MNLGPATDAKANEIVTTCRKHGNDSIIVLSGVAGTGKTFVALAAAVRLAGHPLLVKQIQFHQSFTYEDFIEGLRPNKSGGFDSRSGILIGWNDAALKDSTNKYVLLIEEFTRANISAVLGELMTYIEYRGRLFETPVTRRRLRLANNLTILATMNPQDRSALEIDDALIRRLRIIECPPDTNQLREMLSQSLPNGGRDETEEAIIDQLVHLFEECKRRYPDTFSDLMPFGHGVFSGISSEEDLRTLWQQRLRFLLRRNPQVPPHAFAEDIEELYPWRTE